MGVNYTRVLYRRNPDALALVLLETGASPARGQRKWEEGTGRQDETRHFAFWIPTSLIASGVLLDAGQTTAAPVRAHPRAKYADRYRVGRDHI